MFVTEINSQSFHRRDAVVCMFRIQVMIGNTLTTVKLWSLTKHIKESTAKFIWYGKVVK